MMGRSTHPATALRVLALGLALGFTGGCETIPIPTVPINANAASPAAPSRTSQVASREVENPRLYARDGSVVDAAPRGSVETRDTLGHELQPSGGGRMYILELYQEVINERDQLQRELHHLAQQNEQQAATLTQADLSYARLEETVAMLEQEKRQLVEENLDLAGRLTTAQIRRLEAERLLLQTRIREARDDVMGTSTAATSLPQSAAGSQETP